MNPTLDKANRGLASQWHPTKNVPLTASDVTQWSNKKVWWICNKGHEMVDSAGCFSFLPETDLVDVPKRT